jgi:hypothetical protein
MEREANEMGLHSASFFGRELPPSQRRRHLLIPSGIFGRELPPSQRRRHLLIPSGIFGDRTVRV